MQTVSEAYKNSIKGMKRNRGHIRVSIGVVNQLAQYSANAVNSHNTLIYFSMPQANDAFFGNSTIQTYATDEQDFTKVDGSMYFAPDPDYTGTFFKNGVVTQNLLAPVYIEFSGHTDLDIRGLTIDFGECYPTSFTVQTNNTSHTYENDAPNFKVDNDLYNGTSYMIITPLAMVNGQGRMRILSMSMGVSNIFTDNAVVDFSSKEYVSPVTDSVPSRDISVSIDNRNQFYSPDNPESAIAYMEVGQKVTTQFGYDLDESGTSTEWIAETVTHLSEWKATDSEATFVSADKFYSLTGTYTKGLYRVNGITLYDLALDVLDDAGLSDPREYYLDPYLKDVKAYNPMPPVNHATALQIIANAGRCVLSESRDGRISLKSSFMPDVTVTTNGETLYSNAANIADGEVKAGYAHDSYKFTPVDGSVFFAPDSAPYLHQGYYSNSIYIAEPIELGQQLPIGAVYVPLSSSSDVQVSQYWSDGEPQVILNLEAEYSSFGLKIQFREVYPKAFTVETYYENEPVDSKSYTNDNLLFSTDDVFQSFDQMVITFTEGAPNARVVIDNISLGEMTDYRIERAQMIDTPTATRQRRIKAITATRNVYSMSATLNDISSETITVSSSSADYDIYLNDPYFDFAAVVNSPSGVTVSIIEQSSYHVTLRFSGLSSSATEVNYTLRGKIYTISEISVTKSYHDDGEEIVWNNPLISTTEQAEDLAEWLAEFYLGDVQYDITWRGDPRLDANDLMFIELKDRDDALIRSYQNEITYNGAWRGNIQARKVVME